MDEKSDKDEKKTDSTSGGGEAKPQKKVAQHRREPPSPQEKPLLKKIEMESEEDEDEDESGRKTQKVELPLKYNFVRFLSSFRRRGSPDSLVADGEPGRRRERHEHRRRRKRTESGGARPHSCVSHFRPPFGGGRRPARQRQDRRRLEGRGKQPPLYARPARQDRVGQRGEREGQLREDAVPVDGVEVREGHPKEALQGPV